ncbi:MAG: CYTH domain-containing protein [Anaerolineae bacterium]|nr:CYTH domain-containing protein [Anaerolineae bacterium]
MATKNIETEAKFIIPDWATFAALQQLNKLGDFSINPIGVKEVVDRYLDTADKRIYQAGFTCRIREAKGRQLLSLKSLARARGELHRRQEIEMEVDTDQPRCWAEGEAKSLVWGIIGDAPLQTLFTLYQVRHKFHVYCQQQLVIELSLDKVSLPQAALDYLGLEAELIEAGTEANLARFTKMLQARWPLAADAQSKFERALATLPPGK